MYSQGLSTTATSMYYGIYDTLRFPRFPLRTCFVLDAAVLNPFLVLFSRLLLHHLSSEAVVYDVDMTICKVRFMHTQTSYSRMNT
jgi:hypothetical protein